MEKLQEYINLARDQVIFYSPRLILALLILWIGIKIIKKASGWLNLILEKSGFTSTTRPFLVSIGIVGLRIGLLFTIAGILGIELSIFATIIAASVFAIGLALQGSLGNFASGLIVLSIKPYSVDDWIMVDDSFFGKVEEIGVFNTKILTPGLKTLIIPNAKITSDVVTNYSLKGIVRLELEISMPYSESFPRMKEIILEAVKQSNYVKKGNPIEVGITNFDSHDIKISIRPFVLPDHYWNATYECYEYIKKALSDNSIRVAYSEGVELGQIGA